MEENEEEFFVNKVFENVAAAKNAIALFNKNNFCDFVVQSNNKKTLLAVCKHGIERKSFS